MNSENPGAADGAAADAPEGGRRSPPPPSGETSAAADVRSLERHACPNCGGKGEWSAAKRKLVCPYCGEVFERVAPPPLADIAELDLDAMLAELGERADTVETAARRVRCANCHAVLERGAESVGRSCDFCGSPELLSYEDIESPVKPGSLLAAGISREQAHRALKAFLASKWFAPNDLKRRGMIDRIRGVYLPYWTFDAAAECPWSARSGTYYYVTRKTKNGTRRERRTRWRAASGHVRTWFDDVTVSGSKGIDPEILAGIEPFPTADLVPYETRYVSGWDVEHYQVPPLQAARAGFGKMEAMLREMCAREVPGDTYRALRISPSYSRKTFKHILCPVWLVVYQYRGTSYQGAVNAVTGRACARFPKSAWKIALVVVLALALAALVLYFLNR